MHFDSTLSQDWKTIIKTVVGIFSLFAIVLILPEPIEVITVIQRAIVRVSDGDVYEIQYAKQLSPETFWANCGLYYILQHGF